MTEFKPQRLDKKWQEQWAETRAFEVEADPKRPKFYCLEMFAYPSGHAHVGHVRNYIIGDVMARMKRMRGFNVLHPFGWDAFGLPAENAAIKTGTHPETSTLANIAHMKGQLQRLGISYAWDREIATCLPEYYKFNQWIFLKMFERGIAYRKRSTVNWCPSCQTVLANEQVIDGACWRCGATVVARDLVQWFFQITAYADELLKGLDTLVRVARQGRPDAAELDRPLGRRAPEVSVGRGRENRRAGHGGDRDFHHPDRHHLRRDLRPPRARAPDGRSVRRRSAGPGGLSRTRRQIPRARPRGAPHRYDRQGRIRYGPQGRQPVHEGRSPHLDRQLRARRVRHRRDHGRPGARPARLRVRAQVRPADQARRKKCPGRPRCASRQRCAGVRRNGRGVDQLRPPRGLGRSTPAKKRRPSSRG